MSIEKVSYYTCTNCGAKYAGDGDVNTKSDCVECDQ